LTLNIQAVQANIYTTFHHFLFGRYDSFLYICSRNNKGVASHSNIGGMGEWLKPAVC